MNNSHNERMTKEAKEDALGEALAKAKQMSFAEAKAVYGDDFKINKTVREMTLLVQVVILPVNLLWE